LVVPPVVPLPVVPLPVVPVVPEPVVPLVVPVVPLVVPVVPLVVPVVPFVVPVVPLVVPVVPLVVPVVPLVVPVVPEAVVSDVLFLSFLSAALRVRGRAAKRPAIARVDRFLLFIQVFLRAIPNRRFYPACNIASNQGISRLRPARLFRPQNPQVTPGLGPR
jgi:hypothetical protein